MFFFFNHRYLFTSMPLSTHGTLVGALGRRSSIEATEGNIGLDATDSKHFLTISRIIVDGSEETDVISHSAMNVCRDLNVNPFSELLNVQQLILVEVSPLKDILQQIFRIHAILRIPELPYTLILHPVEASVLVTISFLLSDRRELQFEK